MVTHKIKDISKGEHAQNIRAYSEAMLHGIQEVVKKNDDLMDLNALLFACASIQALFINRIRDEDDRFMMVFEATRMLHFSLDDQRKSGVFDFDSDEAA